jgi:hypothetical protein
MAGFRVRSASLEDLPGIMAVEDCWPEDQRAPSKVFVSRLERFPAGFFVSEAKGRIVGATTSCTCHYDPAQLDGFKTWDQVTNFGLLPEPDAVSDPNALYIVSNGIVPECRGTGIREAHLAAQFELGARLGYSWVLTGAMLPGYDAWCREFGEIPAAEYAVLKKDGRFVDSTVRKLDSLGLRLPGPDHVIAGYYPSPSSRDYGILLVRDL